MPNLLIFFSLKRAEIKKQADECEDAYETYPRGKKGESALREFIKVRSTYKSSRESLSASYPLVHVTALWKKVASVRQPS